MRRATAIFVTLAVLAGVGLAYASYQYGTTARWATEDRNVAAIQGTLAFTHYVMYAEIESFLVRKCYEAALTTAQQLKDQQVRLLYENLRESGNDPDLRNTLGFATPNFFEKYKRGTSPG